MPPIEPTSVGSFLRVETPRTWLEYAQRNERLLLIDHANCERKAANSALAMIHRFANDRNACMALSRIVREELRHFEQVLSLIHARGHELSPLGPSRYARGLHKCASKLESDALNSELLIAAIIEARSCERFHKLIEVLERPIAQFYERLTDAEERHFGFYLRLANNISEQQVIEDQLDKLLGEEARLITENDDQFRFHSGPPSIAKHSKESVD